MNSKARYDKISDKITLNVKIPSLNLNNYENKIEIIIKPEAEKTTQDYLEILKKLKNMLLNPTLTNEQRKDFCKTQRYFMKLYLKEVKKD